MKETHIYTSDEILKMDDLYDIQEIVCSFGSEIKYQMEENELCWLDVVQGHYSIADYLLNNMDKNNIVTINNDVSQAMDDDNGGAGKATMLSDETALQKILFWVYQEQD